MREAAGGQGGGTCDRQSLKGDLSSEDQGGPKAEGGPKGVGSEPKDVATFAAEPFPVDSKDDGAS